MKISNATVKSLLLSSDPEMRKVGLSLVIQYRMVGFSQDVQRLVTDSDPEVSQLALEAVSKLNLKDSAKYMVAVAADESMPPAVRYSAIKALIEMNSAEMMEGEIKKLLGSREHLVKIGAIEAVRRMRDEKFYEDLLGIMCVGDFVICEAAAVAIVRIKSDDKRELFELFSLLLEEEDDAQKYGAIVGLGELGDHSAVDRLLGLLDCYLKNRDMGNSEVMIEAIVSALGKIGSEKALSSVIELLGDTSPEIRLRAVTALGMIEHPDAEPALKSALGRKENEFMKKKIIEALKKVTGRMEVDGKELKKDYFSDVEVEVIDDGKIDKQVDSTGIGQSEEINDGSGGRGSGEFDEDGSFRQKVFRRNRPLAQSVTAYIKIFRK